MLLAAAPARAQETITVEGTVTMKDTKAPVVGATVEFHRIDMKARPVELKTNKDGRYSWIGAQIRGTYTIIVWGPGLTPQYRGNVPVGRVPKTDFEMDAGDGARPTIEQVSAAAGKPMISEAERAAAEKAAADAAAERAKLEEAKKQFDEKKAHFDLGFQAMQAKDYAAAIPEFTFAVEGLDTADPSLFGELVSKASAALAEAHYQVGIDLYNEYVTGKDDAKKAAAKDHLTKGAGSIARAIKIAPENKTFYVIQGKTTLMLVDKYGDPRDPAATAKKADVGANAYLKAAQLEMTNPIAPGDPKKELEYMIKAAEVYRLGKVTAKAIDAYKAVLVKDPNSYDAMIGIGLAAFASEDIADWQTAADYYKLFVDKAPKSDPRVAEAKAALDTLAGKPYNIKPRPIK